METFFKPTFVRQVNSLSGELQKEALEKIELFKKIQNHQHLRVHKLKGGLRGHYSFSVNYKFRIVFSYLSKKEAVLLAIGDHDVYD